ncbi:glycosyltransferase [Streptococcus sp. zg-86]|uniref:Glycosyltransferase n=1 Tax=Streptococcus zhangguiae TaxID=2664091 RepID=A0A6I4RR31_9STRE|nr:MULTISPECIES: glycosyltransferase family 2 protein [unclassified Streptococcus]MTB64702.1 glycosyltransferase [Streptococcus sp. zg-86]MTB91012.1 glycosyltransferase [Streptococcus sp. zg-36]MWV56565.1 glycosyltransferase [Streptococcus sp. zg-70]QTH48529.1 glycosyltransferase family 2 protein [Streptococcus sp. zg-86]
MGHQYVLTVVIPAYNMERYIARAIESLFASDEQYWSCFEVLVINDGSTDHTVEMIKACMEQLDGASIRLISKENGGHGSAINCGISETKGAYLKILDGDDWVDKPAFEALLDALKDSEVDMLVTDFTKQIPAYGQSILEQPVDSSLTGLVQSTLPPKRLPMHSLTYKTALLQKHPFRLTEGIYYVDVEYSLFPMQYVTSWLYLPLNVYQYLFGRKGQSVTLDSLVKNAPHHLQVLKNVLLFRQNIPSDSPLQAMTEDTIISMLEVQEMINHHSPHQEELQQETEELIKQYQLNQLV